MWSTWPNYFQNTNSIYKKTSAFGQTVSVLMGFLWNAEVMHCKEEMPNSRVCYVLLIKSDCMIARWSGIRIGKLTLTQPPLDWTRSGGSLALSDQKIKLQGSHEVPRCDKVTQRNCEAQQAELTFCVHGKAGLAELSALNSHKSWVFCTFPWLGNQ